MVVILRANPASTFMLHFLHAISYNIYNLRHISLYKGAVFAVFTFSRSSRFSRFRGFRVFCPFSRFRVFGFSRKIASHHRGRDTHFLHSGNVLPLYIYIYIYIYIYMDDLTAKMKTYVGCIVSFCSSFESKLLRFGGWK